MSIFDQPGQWRTPTGEHNLLKNQKYIREQLALYRSEREKLNQTGAEISEKLAMLNDAIKNLHKNPNAIRAVSNAERDADFLRGKVNKNNRDIARLMNALGYDDRILYSFLMDTKLGTKLTTLKQQLDQLFNDESIQMNAQLERNKNLPELMEKEFSYWHVENFYRVWQKKNSYAGKKNECILHQERRKEITRVEGEITKVRTQLEEEITKVRTQPEGEK